MRYLRAQRCERAREWASLELDGELSELEFRLLRDHLNGCAGCLRFASETAQLTAVVRAAPLMTHHVRVVVPRARRRVPLRALQFAAAAALLAAVGVAGVVGFAGGSGNGGVGEAMIQVSPAAFETDMTDIKETTAVRRARLIALARPVPSLGHRYT
jgi:predicted anti-sigma-YlaC factor YlaD